MNCVFSVVEMMKLVCASPALCTHTSHLFFMSLFARRRVDLLSEPHEWLRFIPVNWDIVTFPPNYCCHLSPPTPPPSTHYSAWLVRLSTSCFSRSLNLTPHPLQTPYSSSTSPPSPLPLNPLQWPSSFVSARKSHTHLKRHT